MKTKQADPTILSVTLDNPHTGSVRRWLNIAKAHYDPADVGELCRLLAADAERMTDRASCVSPRLCSFLDHNNAGLFVSFSWDEPNVLKHATLPLSETADQWRRRIADVASRHTIYGPG